MITVVISAVLIAIAIPNFRTLLRTKRVEAATQALASSFKLARIEALKRGRQVTVCRSDTPDAAAASCAAGNGNWNTGWILFEDISPPRGTFNGNDTLIKVEAPTSNAIDLTPAALYFLTFRPDGLPVQGNPVPNITLNVLPHNVSASSAGTASRSIVISRVGRVSVTKN